MRSAVLGAVVAGCGFAPVAATAPGDAQEPADASIDAAHDAPRSAACPPSYDVTLSGQTSHYRAIATNAVFWDQHASCDADDPGHTHLVVLDDTTEASSLSAYLVAQTTQPFLSRYYVGAVQDPTAVMAGGGWIVFDGTPLATALWGVAGGLQQPDDGGNFDESDHAEQLAVLALDTSYLLDVRGATEYGAVCECDGKAVDATALADIAGDPNNPNP